MSDLAVSVQPEVKAAGWWRDEHSSVWPLAGIALLLALQASLVFTRAINWDEFFYYHQVAAFRQGELDSALQTFNTRLFYWLPGLFDLNVNHIVAARAVMFGFELGTLAAIYLLARRFTGHVTALLASLLYLSAGSVLQHGFSFRVDPMVTAALMGALVVLARSKLDARAIAAFGGLVALGAMITIKAVLFLPAFAGIALMRLQDDGWSRAMLLRLAACAFSGLALFALLYAWHSAAVTTVADANAHSGTLLGESFNWMFFLGIPPYWRMGVKAAMMAPLFTAIVLATPVLLWRGARPLAEKIGLTGLWLPVLTPFFYMNTAGYFYVYILAPAAVAGVVAIDWARTRFAPMLIAVSLTSIACGIFLLEDRSVIERQRQLERNIYEIFPSPVTYFDHNYMLGSWPKANTFMTPWGMNRYRSAGQPAWRQAMEREVVPLMISNWWTFRAMMHEGDDTLLTPQDNEAMRSNFIEFSPYIYVAGKNLPAGTADEAVEFLVPGPYTVSGAAIAIDGRVVQPGEVVTIARGLHSVSVDGVQDAALTWGDHLPRPTHPLERGPLYVPF